MAKPSQKQIDKFRDTARSLECDESEDRFNAALRDLVKNPSDKEALGKLADELGQNQSDPKGKDRE